MPGMLRLIGLSFLSVGLCAAFSNAQAATARSGAQTARTSSAATQRMPTMPTLPIQVGNMSVDVPTSAPSPSVPDQPEQPDDPGKPDVPDEPQQPQQPECPDGGVKNSKYTIDMCMTDILKCINNGALPHGLNDMFNEDLRNAVVNGMGLCSMQVDKCISDVRRDCMNVYRSAADVWIDFNARKVQPEYYNFVLRKTGLTPNQAENTCWLLDKNTYGTSFAAIDNNGKTTMEYNNMVGAYNNQKGGVLIKNAPQGVQVNNNNPGVDGQRGHYARWDATTATCYLRVAAYNKDKHITNSWLFGAVGDDTPAEVWKAAGDTFSCNKDLFGFSLMNDTSTAAVVGIGGGTLVGAGVGAIAGHGARKFDCYNEGHLKTLTEQLRESGHAGVLNQFLAENPVSMIGGQITTSQCQDIVNLYNVYNEYVVAIDECDGMTYTVENVVTSVRIKIEDTLTLDVPVSNGKVADKDLENAVKRALDNGAAISADALRGQIQNAVAAKLNQMDGGKCYFTPLNTAKVLGTGIYCGAQSGCRNHDEIRSEIRPLRTIFDSLEILRGEKSNMGKSIGVGAAVGAGAGGLATAITAFVEKNNINCRVGDGLAQVGFGKPYAIGTLKDFYVKWNLRLPDVIAPTAMVTDCQSWKNTCATFTDLNHCKNAQFNYKPVGAPTATLVRSVCAVSGSVCIENYPVAKSYGACK